MTETTIRRRRHGADLKARILAECDQPGTSIAAVAMAYGINANLVHKWRAQALKRQDIAATANAATFIPVPILAQSSSTASVDLRIELRRGSVTITVCWPVSAAIECAAWVREVLR